MDKFKSILDRLPQYPGVYLFKDAGGKIIYVGKAKNLFKRVRSYFLGVKDAKTGALQKKISDIEYFVTNGEAEALILENNLIKENMPRYNIRLKDSKSYPMIKIVKEKYPRILKCREKNNRNDEYYGPFVDNNKISILMDFFKKNLKLRLCSRKLSSGSRAVPCLNYHIKRCLAPCASKITEEEYNDNIRLARDILKGDISGAVSALRREMEENSAKFNYEKAAEIRDKIIILENIEEKQLVELSNPDNNDYVGYYTDFNAAAFSVIKQREGKIIGKENFIVSNVMDFTVVLEDFLKSYYLNIAELPEKIFIQTEIEEVKPLYEALLKKFNKSVSILVPSTLADKNLTRLSIKNAEILFQEKQYKIDKIHILREVQKALKLNKLPRTIECFDIATLNGKFNTASLVSLVDGKPNKSGYRQFNVEGEGYPDDYAMMIEVVGRRYQRLKNEGLPLPDLIVVDGGKGQVKSAKTALDILDIQIPLIGLAKKNEEIFFPNTGKSLILPRDSKALKIIQLARDEAHRFSNTRLSGRYRKSALATELLKIKGVGDKKSTALLKKFKSLKRIKAAEVEEIASIKEIGSSLAKKIYDYLHK
ncbi:MAG TPA: excinuclease ABC subunit UvrC [Spirochaetota bacterium]|jgi:excinuclease ABC subunit C|nr:MAG: UvrABC system protein C [Spirochaetes bacterium ADurb.Bin133]HPY88597.1 excinuclease ABC subunit UvrC [Spirochaetota bacterium]HQB60249.1 excinuclease ABC subunit UvrC [Spirochaetota bacterium]